jgi:hypothetical protein
LTLTRRCAITAIRNIAKVRISTGRAAPIEANGEVPCGGAAARQLKPQKGANSKSILWQRMRMKKIVTKIVKLIGRSDVTSVKSQVTLLRTVNEIPT